MSLEATPSIQMQTITNDSAPASGHSMSITILSSVIVGVVIFMTVIGNLLVIVSFFTTSRLRTYNNYFILGLAIADLVVGAIDMPLFAVIFLTGRWPLGGIACDVFTFLDHAFSHASILLVTLISLDRCVAVTHPFRHRHHWRRRSRAILIIAVGYIVPVFLWLPLTALYPVICGIVDRPIPEDVCEPLYMHYSVIISVFVPVIFLHVPFIITAILCIRIYIAIKSFYKNRKKMTIISGNAHSVESDFETRDTTNSVSLSQIVGPHLNNIAVETNGDAKEIPTSGEKFPRYDRKVKLHNESLKGIRTLVFIVAAMGVAWFPGTSIIIVSSICPTCVPGVVYSVMIAVFWGYTNSLINPVCYALADKSFKDAFTRILTLRFIEKDTP